VKYAWYDRPQDQMVFYILHINTSFLPPLAPTLEHRADFLIILQRVGLLGWAISSSQGLYQNTGQHKHRLNAYAHQTSMPCVGFEPTIPASEQAKTLHAIDLSATVTGISTLRTLLNSPNLFLVVELIFTSEQSETVLFRCQ
jgi:hypothetical protein